MSCGLPASNIPLNLPLSFRLPRLVSVVFRKDLVEQPGAFLRRVVEFMTLDSSAKHDLKVALVMVKHPASHMVLPQDLSWSGESHPYLRWKGKLKINRTGLHARLQAGLAYLILHCQCNSVSRNLLSTPREQY